MQASTRGTTRRWMGSMPSTIIASSSSRILRAPRSAAMADPPAPAIRSEVTIGPASRTTASTDAEPVKDWAPNCWIRPPTCSAMTAPNGIATRAVGTMVTESMNQACWMNSRSWKGRRNSARATSRAKANRLPAAPIGARAREDVDVDMTASGPRRQAGVAGLEGSRRRGHAVLAAPLPCRALAATRDAVGRLLLERDGRQRGQLLALLRRELVGVLLLGHADRADALGIEELSYDGLLRAQQLL